MAINKTVKPTSKNSPSIVKAKQGDNGPAEQYAARGTGVTAEMRDTGAGIKDPNTLSGQQVNRRTLAMDVSIGNIGPSDAPVKPSLTMRGAGAAERGNKTSTKMG